MSIFQTLLELQVNGKDANEDEDNFDIDDTIDDNEDVPAGDTAGEPAPDVEATVDTDEDDNFTIDDDEDGIDDASTEDDGDNFTLDDSGEESNVDNNEANEEENASNDDTQSVRDISEEPAIGDNSNTDADNNSDDDFTMDSSDNSNDETSDTSADNKGEEKEQPSDPTDAIADDEKRAAEEAIYNSLTDDQKRIRVLQLKIDYKDLYETMVNTIEGINNIPKNTTNLETIKRLNVLLTKAKTILISYINNNFDQCTYLENYTTYLKYLALFRTTANVIEEVNSTDFIK